MISGANQKRHTGRLINGWRIGRFTGQVSFPGNRVYKAYREVESKKFAVGTEALVVVTGTASVIAPERIVPARMMGTFRSWAALLTRTGNRRRSGGSGSASIDHYTRKGIKVCDAWVPIDNSNVELRRAFLSFFEYMYERPDGMHIDRIDSDGNYEPGNVQWSDAATMTPIRYRTRHLG